MNNKERFENFINKKRSEGETELFFMDILVTLGITEKTIKELAEELLKEGKIKDYHEPQKTEGEIIL